LDLFQIKKSVQDTVSGSENLERPMGEIIDREIPSLREKNKLQK